MEPHSAELRQEDGRWALRVKTPAGISMEYLYPSETQARYFAAVFALGPTTWPPPSRVIAIEPRKKPRTRKRRMAALPIDAPPSRIIAMSQPPTRRRRQPNSPIANALTPTPAEIDQALDLLGS